MKDPFFYAKNSLPIKGLQASDRPRERLSALGPSRLSTAELLAVLLGSGTKGYNALEMAQGLLANHKNNLYLLSHAQHSELQKVKGIGEARALSLCAVFELAKRVQEAEIPPSPSIHSSADAFTHLKLPLGDLKYEEFWVLYLNRRNQLLKKLCISSGGVSGTVVDAKMVFKPALDLLASQIILAHNHPSGNLKPSTADKNLTQKLKRAAQSLDIQILDHLIIASRSYLSFSDEGLL